MCGCNTPSIDAAVAAIDGATFKVEDMTCGHCVGTIRKALEAGMPGTPISIDLDSHVVRVSGDATRAEGIIREAGYEPQLIH